MTETSGRDPPPVLVVGAGPTGMLMAGELARHGVRCRLVDEERERRTAPRAVNLHARSLEVFENLGIAEAAVERGCRVSAVNFYTRGRERQSRRVARIKLGQMDSPYPFMLGIPQPETERVLEQFAVDRGVRVERLVRLVDLSQNEGGVDVELEQVVGGERERAHFDWVIGCDGAHSTVRKKLG